MRFLIAGDSHTQYFGISNQLRNTEQALRGVRAACKTISASTIAGVGKVDSTLKFGKDVHHWVDEVQPDYLVMNLGQVDIELGIPFRQFVKDDKRPYKYWISHFINIYLEFLQAIQLAPKQILIKGTNLPVLCYDHSKAIQYISRIITERFTDDARDNKRKELILIALKDRYPSDVIRTEISLEFNRQLKSACIKNGYPYFDINDKLASPDTGTIDPRFIPAKFDHHIVDTLETRAMHWNSLISTVRENFWNAEQPEASCGTEYAPSSNRGSDEGITDRGQYDLNE